MNTQIPRAESSDEKQFWNAVDTFIDAANTAAQECDPGIVSSAVLYAATRYCAFHLASMAESREDFVGDTEEAIRHYGAEFKKLMAEHMADYGENFKVYLREEAEDA